MTTPNVKEALLARFHRFYSEGYSVWNRDNLQKELHPIWYHYDLDDPMIQKILAELEQEGFIKLYFENDRYLEVLSKSEWHFE